MAEENPLQGKALAKLAAARQQKSYRNLPHSNGERHDETSIPCYARNPRCAYPFPVMKFAGRI